MRSFRVPAGFPLLIALIALVAAAKPILYDTLDPDCFWHLRVADQLLHDGIHPLVDHLSFASEKSPWTPYSWLAELFMRGIWQMGGYRLAIGVQSVTQSAFVVLLALGCRELQWLGSRRINNDDPTPPPYLPAILATAAGTYLTLPYLSFRPVTFAITLLGLCVWTLLRDRRMGGSKLLWFVIPLTILLTNVHLFAVFIPAIAVALLIGSLAEGDRNLFIRYCTLFAATAAAVCCTPMFPGMIRTMFFYGTQDKMVSGPVIAEMQSFAAGPMGIAALGIIVATAGFAAMNRKRLALGEWLCLIVATILLFSLGRFAPIYTLIGAPVLAATFPPLSDRLLSRPPLVALLGIIILIGSIQISRVFPPQNQTIAIWLNRNGPDFPGYPTAAADYLDHSIPRATGKILNEFNWGGYLAWRLPDRQVLLDGRTQVYPPQLWQATYLAGPIERRNFLAAQQADAALLPRGKSKFRNALLHLGWRTAYSDDRAEILIPPAAVATVQ